jgi:hypothetical protein
MSFQTGSEFDYFYRPPEDDSVSPGFLFSRTGNSRNNDWFKAGENFSNVTGWPFGLNLGQITGIWVGCQNPSTFDISIYEHQGSEVNLTLLTTVSVTVATTNAFFYPSDFGNIGITQGYQMAARVTSGNLREGKVILFAQGTN